MAKKKGSAAVGPRRGAKFTKFGHSAASLIRWCGSAGFTKQQTRKALNSIGLKKVADGTIRIQLHLKDNIPTLTADVQQALRKGAK